MSRVADQLILEKKCYADYILVQGGPDTPIDFVLGNPGSGSHVGCLPSLRSSYSLVHKSGTSETRFKALQAVHLL